jgi:hypothetical protein
VIDAAASSTNTRATTSLSKVHAVSPCHARGARVSARALRGFATQSEGGEGVDGAAAERQRSSTAYQKGAKTSGRLAPLSTPVNSSFCPAFRRATIMRMFATRCL